MAKNCMKRFCEIYPEHGFLSSKLSLEVVERSEFITRLIAIEKEHPLNDDPESTVIQNFSGCDAATMRTPKKDYIVVSFDAEDEDIYFIIRTYHELSHVYSIHIQEKNHPINLTETKSDALVGHLFWKEFIADYLALNALHRDFSRFEINSLEAKNYIKASLQNMVDSMYPANQGSMSGMANLFAFLFNLEGFIEGSESLKLPIKRRSAIGKGLIRYIQEMVEELREKCKESMCPIVDEEYLYSIGGTAIEIQLYVTDYADENDW